MSSKQAVRTILENEAVALWYYPGKKMVHHEIRRFVHGDQFRELLEKGLEAFRSYGASKWLSDDRGNGPLTPADGEWARTEWRPRVLAAGWRHWAVVLPVKVMGQMNMQRWIDECGRDGISALAFSEPAEAMSWLEAQ